MQSTPGYSGQGYPFPQQTANMSDSLAFQPPTYVSTSDPNWGYTTGPITRNAVFPAPVLRPFGRNSSPTNTPVAAEAWNSEDSARGDNDMIPYRTWQADSSSYHTLDNTSGHAVYGNAHVDPSPRGVTASHSSNSDIRETPWPTQSMASTSDVTHQRRHAQEPFITGSSAQADGSVYSTSYPQQHSPHTSYYSGSYTHNTPPAPPPQLPSSIPPLPRHTYTRTLVGPLSANACRLLDENRKPGIFFLFQDLSVRTEGRSIYSEFNILFMSSDLPSFIGTFRLRLRLMNVGA